MTADDVRELLKQPERADLEFKQRYTRETPRAIVAMANGQGGTIVVGVSDSSPRRIVGVDAPFDQIEGEILNALRDRVKPLMHPLPQLGRDLSSNLFVDRRMIEGTATELIEQGVRFVLDNMKVGGIIQGIFREDIPEYPEEAVREAMVNAVIHRDYSIQQKILVRMFDDRLEIENPGGLPSGVTLEMLLQNPRPYPRNPLVVRTLYDWWRGKGIVE
ncbi:MAG: putative DNA binding domain-containing protein, partial [Chloroflexi bacterium]|nr:putative DNA binding domain-containing protein [Chloroflexota bacterium]